MSRLTVVCTVLFALCAGPVFAQSGPDPKAEPWRDARLKIGPIFFNPTFQVKDFGVDDNVYNVPENATPTQDLTGTLAMSSLMGIHIRSFLLTANQTNSYVWFRRERSERSVDGGLKATAELRLNRIRPWATIERARTHDRGGYEIDARAGRDLPAIDYGTDIKFGWRLGATVGYRSDKIEYAEDEFFDGTDLRRALNHKTQTFRGVARFQLSTFTDLVAGGSISRERYVTNLLRDADTVSYFAGLESSSDAPLGVNLSVGWTEQTHKDPSVPDFKGVTGSGGFGFVIADTMRVNLTGMRGTGMSYDELYPFFVEEGGSVDTTIRFSEHFDLKFDAKSAWLKYRLTVTGAEADRTDRSLVAGAEFGYYFGGLSGTRVGIRYEYAERVSPIEFKNYKRSRFYSDFRLSF